MSSFGLEITTDVAVPGSSENSNVSDLPVRHHKRYVLNKSLPSMLEKSTKSETLCKIPENVEVGVMKSSSSMLSPQYRPTRNPRKFTSGRGTPTKIPEHVTGTLAQSSTVYGPIDSPRNRLAIRRAMLVTPEMIIERNEDIIIMPSLKNRMEEDISRILMLPEQELNTQDILHSLIDVLRYWVLERDRSVELEADNLMSRIHYTVARVCVIYAILVRNERNLRQA